MSNAKLHMQWAALANSVAPLEQIGSATIHLP